MNKVEEQYEMVDIKKLANYIASKELEEYVKNLDPKQVYQTDIQDKDTGKAVVQVYLDHWASWAAVTANKWEEMIMLFTKPTE